jgi:glycosylphosphatidylinositol transamidase (GPIT) subunit GPI8
MIEKYNEEEEIEYMEKAKELALISSYITSKNLLNGTLFNTFDRAWVLAIEFLELYPSNSEWTVNNPWDAVLEEFVNERYLNAKKI